MMTVHTLSLESLEHSTGNTAALYHHSRLDTHDHPADDLCFWLSDWCGLNSAQLAAVGLTTKGGGPFGWGRVDALWLKYQ